MSKVYNVAVVVGSIRKDSLNRKLAHALIEAAPATIKATIVGIAGLPIYNPDDDGNPPASWVEFRAA